MRRIKRDWQIVGSVTLAAMLCSGIFVAAVEQPWQKSAVAAPPQETTDLKEVHRRCQQLTDELSDLIASCRLAMEKEVDPSRRARMAAAIMPLALSGLFIHESQWMFLQVSAPFNLELQEGLLECNKSQLVSLKEMKNADAIIAELTARELAAK